MIASSSAQKLRGKVALVTGASRGIGRAIAAAYTREGARVFACARHQENLDRAIAEIAAAGGEIAGVAGDVGSAQDVERIVRAATDRFGIINVLVNNASVLGPRVDIADYPLAAWQEVINVNLTGIFMLTRAVVPIMRKQRSGAIINVSSGVGRNGKARWGAYAVSKAGIECLTQILADELKGSGVRVNAVNPAATRTEMRAQAYPQEDPQSLPSPEGIMPIFVDLASDDTVTLSGASLDARNWTRLSH
ncbi:MAG TPA: SDR family NAD(P)-dependent oxidoreductase [Candidatus Eisenbacteria bacterium]|jgi:NAD(P)-dependent dehydrogenase (short-subunit alcohol dehydrogenase family)|nr:SDR family NAD(P)-dependent oxidoreductase [Candidatus Eisenbacteria bacterium]